MSQAKTYTLIFLYDKMALSLPVAQTLKEKNIEVHVAQNAGELIQLIASKNVDMVGLSANHASSRSLIQVLREKTHVKILAFGEDKMPSTAQRIDKMDADFKILGVATAYNIWMKIAPSVKAKMKEHENNGNVLYSGGSSTQQKSHQAIIVKNSKGAAEKEKADSGANIISSGKKKKDKNKRKNAEPAMDDTFEQGDSPAQGNDVMFFKKDAPVSKESKRKDKSDGLSKKSSLGKNNKKTQKDIDAEFDSMESMVSPNLSMKKAPTNDDVEVDIESAQANTGGGKMEQEVPDELDGSIIQVGLDKNPDAGIGSVDNLGAESKVGKLLKFDKKNKKKLKGKANKEKESEEEVTAQAADEVAEEIPQEPLENIIQKAALSAYVSVEPGKENFGSINKMTVIPVDRDVDRGFIIFCTNDNQFLSTIAASMDTFKNSLQETLAEQGMVVVGESYNIETEEVEILNWVLEKSQFHYMFEDAKSQKQIMICFLPKENIYPDTNKSTELNMLKVELDVIPPATPLNFNVFIYLARNNRVVPYIRRGGKFTDEQMARLGDHGVDSVYINEEDRKALYSFFISQTIGQDLRPIKKAA